MTDKKTPVARPPAVKKRAGAPSAMTPTRIEKMLKAIKAGSYIETAAAYAGIHKDTYYEWMKKGSNEREAALKENREVVTDLEQYVKFSDSIKEALAEAEIRHVLSITKAAEKNWTAAAWMLERRNPTAWGYKQQVDQSINAGSGKITIIVEDYLPEKKPRLIDTPIEEETLK